MQITSAYGHASLRGDAAIQGYSCYRRRGHADDCDSWLDIRRRRQALPPPLLASRRIGSAIYCFKCTEAGLVKYQRKRKCAS